LLIDNITAKELVMKILLPLWIIVTVLFISACSDVPRQGNNEVALPLTSKPQEVAPADMPTKPTATPGGTAIPKKGGLDIAKIQAYLTEAAKPSGPIVTADKSNVNIRSGPSTDHSIVGKLLAGQSLEIVGRNSNSTWWQVPTPNGLGWVAAQVTKADNVNASIPVVEADSPPVQAVAPIPTAVIVAPPPSMSAYAGSYDPSGPDRDCPDFSTHAEAQAFFVAAGGPTSDPHRLDGDNDGSACENNP
jgi:uncharacterized protein YraI